MRDKEQGASIYNAGNKGNNRGGQRGDNKGHTKDTKGHTNGAIKDTNGHQRTPGMATKKEDLPPQPTHPKLLGAP